MTMRRLWSAVAAVALSVVGLSSVVIAVTAPSARADVTTGSNDNARDGWYPDEAALSPQVVAGSSFGKLFTDAVVGQVYAQPIVANGVLVIATEDDKVYGLDAATGALRWGPVNLGVPWNSADIGCGDLAPHVGVTGTPVVDPATGTVYMVSKTYATGTSGPAAYSAHALDVATGVERPGYPVPISGTASNSATTTFQPTTQLQRPALLLNNGTVYAAFGSHCDIGPYAGWIAGIPTWQTGQTAQAKLTTLWTDAPGNNGGGIWGGGSGLMSDGTGQLVFAAGNGKLDPTIAAGPVPGNQVPTDFAQTITRLVVQPDGSLKPTDFFAPYDAAPLNMNDQDVGSGGPVALPPQFGAGTTTPNLLAQIGKEGYVYLLNRDNLGGYQQAAGGDASVARVGPYGGAWTRPAAWPGDGGYIYLTTSTGGVGALSGNLRAFKYGLDGNGHPTLSLAATSPDSFGFGSGAPVVTSSGTTSGTGIVWVEWSPDGSGANAQLRAYSATPVNGGFQLLWSSPIGTGSKFAIAAVDHGRVYVGTRDGNVVAYGSPVPVPMSATPLAFPTTIDGQTSPLTATFTANQAINVTGFASDSAVFQVGGTYSVNGGASQPITTDLSVPLSSGNTIAVTTTFAPTKPGLASGNLNVTTSAGPVSVSMTGQGESPNGLLVANPTMISLGAVSVSGPPVSGSVVFANEGATSITVNGETSPSAPFSQSGLPAVGATLAPGGSVTVTVTDTPNNQTGPVSSSLTLDTSGGNITVPVTATLASPPTMVITPLSSDFGNVPIGLSGSTSFTISNTGGSPLTVSKSKPPALGIGFTASTSLPEGTTIPAGGVVTETVSFTATTQGTFHDQWVLNGNDGSGLQNVTFTATAVPNATLPDPTSGSWQLNGSSTIIPAVTNPATPAQLQLTSTAVGQAGSAFWPVTTSSRYFSAAFDATIIGGTGADGMTLLLADPAAGATAGQVGAPGSGLGFVGIPSIAVALVTYQNGNGANLVGITNGYTPGTANLNWLASTNNIPPLRAAVVHVVVTAANGVLTVAVNGTQVLSQAVALPPNVLIGFTGGTGGITDDHEVANVAITTQAPPAPTLQLNTAVAAPAGSTQQSQTFSYTGNCPSSFTTAAQGNASQVSPTLTGALAFDNCNVTQSAPTGTGWSTAVSVNGGPAQPVAANANGTVTVPPFELTYGPNTVTLTNTYQTGPPPSTITLPDPTGGSWQLNGSATIIPAVNSPATPAQLQLTSTAVGQAGSAFWPMSAPSTYIRAAFDATIAGGSGADGLTLTLADASAGTAHQVGASGSGLGFAGIPGIAVGLDTYPANLVGITNGYTAGTTNLNWLASSTSVPNLRAAVDHVVVTASSNVLTVVINGFQVLSQAVTLSPNVLIGFTGANGGLADNHEVANVAITTQAPPAPTLQLNTAVAAPAGSTQQSQTFSYTGNCPSSFTTAAQGNAGQVSPPLTGALASDSCNVTESAPIGAGWSTVISVNGGAAQPVAANANGTVTVPTFPLTSGPNTVTFTNTYQPGSPPPAVPPPSATAWQLNGSATMVGTSLRLTPATHNLAGSAFYRSAISSTGFTAAFDANLAGGTGGDGITLTLADPSRGAKPTSLGRKNDGLGFGGIPGVAVALVTHGNGTIKSNNFVGITNGQAATAPNYLTWLATNTSVPPLRNTTVHVTVTAVGGKLTVTVNGTTVLSTAVTLPPQVLVGFTGSTGASFDTQAVSNVVIDPPGTLRPPSAGGWSANGTAIVTGGQVQLTPATVAAAGSSFSPIVISPTNLQVAFDSTINSGGGADGLTLTLANATAGATATALGGNGWGLGFAGIPGIAVGLNTYPSSQVGITNGPNSTNTGLNWLASSTSVPDLRAAVRHVVITYATGVLTVDVAGTQVVSLAVTLPPSVLVGFTGATGGQTDIHAVSNISITYQ